MARNGGPIRKNSESYVRRSGDAKKALAQVQANLQAVIEQIQGDAEVALEEIALTIQNTSNRYAPLDDGELRESSYIEKEVVGDRVTFEVGYTADHSVYTHEIFAGPGETYKDPTTPGTFPKYLERAVIETEDDIATIVADAIRNNLR